MNKFELITISILLKICRYFAKKSGNLELQMIVWDTTKPNGTPRKRLDLTKLNKLGWHPQYSLEEGLKITYEHFQKENNI